MHQATSKTAYFEDVLPRLSAKQQEVLAIFEPGCDYTNNEIAQALGKPINEITPRTGELTKAKRIYVHTKRVCTVHPGRPVTAYMLMSETLFG